MQTVQTLQVLSYQDSSKQAQLAPSDYDTLDIGDIAFIFYGTIQNDFNENFCDADLFSWTVVEEIQNDDQHYIATLYQNIYNLIPEDGTEEFLLNITLLGAHDLYINFNHQSSDLDAIIDRNFSGYQTIATQFNIWNFLTVNTEENNFYFEVFDPNDDTSIILSTQNTVNFLGELLYVQNFFYPNSISTRFFGLGERNGPFFLEDQNWYALYSSNKRMENQQHSNGKYMQFSKSGYFPILYSQYKEQNANLYTGLISLQEGGGDFLFFTGESSPQTLSPQLAVLSSFPQDFIFTFHDDISPVSQHLATEVILGPMYERQHSFVFPPPEYIFGTYVDVQDYIQSPGDLDLIINYYQDTLGWPIEGFLMSYSSLEGYQSLTFNSTTYPDPQSTFQELEAQGYTMINIMQPGINLYSENQADQDLIAAGGLILNPDGETPLVGQDSSGTVYYPDFTHEASQQFLIDSIQNYSSFYGVSRTPIKFKKNEITNQYCKGDCLEQNLVQQVREQFYRPGVIEMLSNLLAGDNLRQVGSIQQTHNLNGLISQMQLANAFEDRYNHPIISDSITTFSSEFGNVGHVLDFLKFNNYDASHAAAAIQGISMMGIGMVGMELDVQYNSDLSKEGLLEFQFAFETLFKLQAFCPLSFSSLIIPPQLKDVPTDFLQVFAALARVRYQFMRFTRTKIYARNLMGEFYITPLFYEFPNDDNTYDYIQTQFIVGK